jgi:septum formation inhibitor-activating ATPase MinD
MRVFLSTLGKLRMSGDAIGVVLNKVEDDVGIKISDVQEVLENRIISILPYSTEVSRSINKGTPALVSAADSQIGKKLATGMLQLIGEDASPSASFVDEESRGGIRRLMRRNKSAPMHAMSTGGPR